MNIRITTSHIQLSSKILIKRISDLFYEAYKPSAESFTYNYCKLVESLKKEALVYLQLNQGVAPNTLVNKLHF